MKKIKLDLFDQIIIGAVAIAALILLVVFFRKSTYISVMVRLNQDNSTYAPWTIQTGTRPWFANLIEAGMEEKDGLGRPVAMVEKLQMYSISPEKYVVYAKLKLKATYTKSSDSYSYKGRPLAVGELITINLQKISVNGFVTAIEGLESKQKKVTLEIDAQVIDNNAVYPNTSGVESYIADAINTGDTIKDLSGQTLVTVESITARPADLISYTDAGQAILTKHPKRKDLFLKLKVNGYELAGRYYFFDDVPLNIAYGIPLNFTNVYVHPVITSMKVID